MNLSHANKTRYILLDTGKNIKQALIERFGHFYRRAPPHESAILLL